MTERPGSDLPDAEIDVPDLAPGGADAVVFEEDRSGVTPVTPDEPRSAQIAEADVPEEIQQPEEPDSEPSGADESAESATDVATAEPTE